MNPIDPVTLVVVQNGLQQVAGEMDLTFERAAFSPVISQGFDRSDGIYDKDAGDRATSACRGPCLRRYRRTPSDDIVINPRAWVASLLGREAGPDR